MISEATSVSRMIGPLASAKVGLAGCTHVGEERLELLVALPEIRAHVLARLDRPHAL